MESKEVLHNSTSCEDSSHDIAHDIAHDSADIHHDHQSHNHQSQQFGRSLHLAMACINGAERLQHSKTNKANFNQQGFSESTPRQSTKKELSSDLYRVSTEIDTNRAELVELMVQFDEQQGWADSGARNCADWVNANLGIGQSSAYQFLRVGRELRDLPIIRALFRCGELSWSKVKILTTVADADNEQDLAHVSLTATVTDVERICREFRWAKAEEEGGDPATGRTKADLRAESQYNNRSLTTHEQPDGSIVLRISLPPEKAQAVLNSLEHCQNELYQDNAVPGVERGDDSVQPHNNDNGCTNTTDQPSIRQRRADALVLMAERSLQSAGSDVSRSDRYQVILHVENSLNETQSSLGVVSQINRASFSIVNRAALPRILPVYN